MNPIILIMLSLGLGANRFSIFGSSVALDGIAPGKYVSITPEEAKQMMEADPELLVIDVRNASDYYMSHLPRSINIPLNELVARITKEFPDLNTRMVLYCKGGHRSRQAAQVLASIGYQEVYNMGSLEYWPYDFVTERLY